MRTAHYTMDSVIKLLLVFDLFTLHLKSEYNCPTTDIVLRPTYFCMHIFANKYILRFEIQV